MLSLEYEKYFLPQYNATFTNPIITGTSISGPITAVNASFDSIPNTATATAIASSKLLLAAVNAKCCSFVIIYS